MDRVAGRVGIEQGLGEFEDLGGIAERGLVQKNARWALKRGVFEGKDLEEAFDTLRNYDQRDPDPGSHLRGEYAFSMQTTQYIFPPTGPGGEPQLDLDRARSVVDETWIEDDEFDRIARMKPDDARASVSAFDAAYREMAEMMRIGYPEFRTADFSAVREKYVHATPLTEAFMPDLSFYYQLRAREEASSRATQLAYATHLFKAEHGRFPESLSELPADYGDTMRIDPFTGDYFGYRVTDDGPVIYSASENGRDDGGVHSPRWADKIENDAGSDDHVFYPPQ
ncbi:MAG: hypothetical protein IID42_04795 [Planctomycetes bacterium]|nr:hypothetical protein [Planctomycetota bacterium]